RSRRSRGRALAREGVTLVADLPRADPQSLHEGAGHRPRRRPRPVGGSRSISSNNKSVIFQVPDQLKIHFRPVQDGGRAAGAACRSAIPNLQRDLDLLALLALLARLKRAGFLPIEGTPGVVQPRATHG